MAAVLMRRGADGMSARQISDQAELLGMRLSSGGTSDYASVTWQAPSRNFGKAWELYRAVLTQPSFPSDEVTKVRQDLIQQVQSLGDRPFELTNLRFAEAIYKRAPYRRLVSGDEASLKKISASDLRDAYRTQFSGSNLVVSISGDFDPEAVLALARKTLGSIPKGSPVAIGGVRDEPAGETNPVFVEKDQEQITYNTGWLGCSVLDPDYVPLRAGVVGRRARGRDRVRHEAAPGRGSEAVGGQAPFTLLPGSPGERRHRATVRLLRGERAGLWLRQDLSGAAAESEGGRSAGSAPEVSAPGRLHAGRHREGTGQVRGRLAGARPLAPASGRVPRVMPRRRRRRR